MPGRWTFLHCFSALVLSVNARGPICLDGTKVASPPSLVKECWPWESCSSSHHFDTDGSQYFNFGCRSTQECETHSRLGFEKRVEIKVCDKCCTGDVCNTNICVNDTVPDRGLACLECASVPSIISCNHLTYCSHGEVCYTQKSPNGPHPKFTMGCMRKDICALFEGETIVGKRSDVADEESANCHKCCEEPGCNRDACAEPEVTTPGIQTTVGPQAHDCWDLMNMNNVTSDGVHDVFAPEGNKITVRCDMTTAGGGWVVFQRRVNGEVSFNRTYSQYRDGFGELSGEFWMGNYDLHELTKNEKQRLRIDICDWSNNHRWAEYDFFMVGPAADHFRLSVAAYHGSAGDALITGSGGNQFHHNHLFSTPDQDNDVSPHRNCAKEYHSGWWFGDCFSGNLNGLYNITDFITEGRGLRWRPWMEDYSFKHTEMKFRPAYVQGSTNTFSC